MTTEFKLTPAQQAAAEELLAALASSRIVLLQCGTGKGRSTLLRYVHSTAGGALVGLNDFLDALRLRRPLAIEEAVLEVFENRQRIADLVIVDDFYALRDVVEQYDYPRRGLLDALLIALADRAGAAGKQLLFGLERGGTLDSIVTRARVCQVKEFTGADFEQVFAQRLPSAIVSALDVDRIYRFAPTLNLWQLGGLCDGLRDAERNDTESFIEFLSAHNMASNVQIEEVRKVELTDIKGADDVIAALEAKVILPFENPQLAVELDLKPRRGVLLSGPPGTGKTTIGRALARRLKSKFFLIDGNAISGSDSFYSSIGSVFSAAKQNAPAIIFIDDADVMFEDGGDRGLYRYLLTQLDGLESESSERVCVMMTAMQPSSLPAALLRSGRVELWLETRLPDPDARTAIFRESLAKLPEPLSTADCVMLAALTQGLTGADMRALIEDAKLLFAHDKATGKTVRAIEEYFLEAIETVRENRRSYARRRSSGLTEVARIGFEIATTEEHRP